MKLRVWILFLIIIGVLCSPCNAADVLFIGSDHRPSIGEQQLQFAARLYGLDVEWLFVRKNKPNDHVIAKLKRSNAGAVVLTAAAISIVEGGELQPTLYGMEDKRVPLLITDVTPTCNSTILSQWSGGVVLECLTHEGRSSDLVSSVTKLKNVAKELSGVDIPFTKMKWFYLGLDSKKDFQSIMEVVNKDKPVHFPIFIKTTIKKREIFFQPAMPIHDSDNQLIWQYDMKQFYEIAPLLMFLRYSLGERCWHTVGHYANLTIDDPWLIEPYGHLSYESLVKEMCKVNFHTTIAFIPWNFDRSTPEVVSLFRKYPDRFSICIHGNNHDHYEFYKYQAKAGDPWPAKPLNVHEMNIKQALVRMEKFNNLTGLSYDRVMVFPQSIAPTQTLGLLKKYNFLATSNARNVPLGAEEPTDPLFSLRPFTLEFENFLSFRRFSPDERSKTDFAIDLFLGNPILLYGHHHMFAKGIGAFNKVAEMINSIDPEIEWRNLGDITRHLYLQRARNDGNYDVRAFCKSIELKNMRERDLTYFVRKQESLSPNIKRVTVGGDPYPYGLSLSDLSLKIDIPAGASRIIDIEYENDFNLKSIGIAKDDPYVDRLRSLSDFRDMTLAKNLFGRAFIHVYYETGLFKVGLKRLALFSFLLVCAISAGGWYLIIWTRRRHTHRASKIVI